MASFIRNAEIKAMTAVMTAKEKARGICARAKDAVHGLKELVQVRLEHALVVVDQSHAGKRYADAQDHNLQSAHKELEIEDKVHDNENQCEDRRHKSR